MADIIQNHAVVSYGQTTEKGPKVSAEYGLFALKEPMHPAFIHYAESVKKRACFGSHNSYYQNQLKGWTNKLNRGKIARKQKVS